MIDRFLKNDVSRRRWRVFLRHRRAVFATWALIALAFFSFSAEFWANSRPLLLRFHGSIYFPVLKDYHPTVFGRKDILYMDYRSLEMGEGDFAIWPLIAWDPFEANKDVATYPSGPSFTNLMGTDEGGRDVFTRLLYGFRYSITYAGLVWFFSTLLGIVMGAIMGYVGGVFDLVGQRLVEVWNTIPVLFILIILISIFGASLFMLVMITILFGWMMISYYIRGEFLKNRKREYVEAARALGASHGRIVFRHILPNSLVPVITFAPFIIATHIYGLAGLDYLGFGLPAPTPSWGELLSQAQKNFTIAWWLALYPSLALFSTLVLWALVGEGVRQALDPNA